MNAAGGNLFNPMTNDLANTRYISGKFRMITPDPHHYMKSKHIQSVVTDYNRQPIAPKFRLLDRVGITAFWIFVITALIWMSGTTLAQFFAP